MQMNEVNAGQSFIFILVIFERYFSSGAMTFFAAAAPKRHVIASRSRRSLLLLGKSQRR